MAGLSAGWKLDKLGVRDWVILEMDDVAGGNARGGRNEVSPYPFGAHYLPIPGAKAVEVRELLKDLGVLTGFRDGQPVYDETALAADPQERLFLHGAWQEGLIPERGVPETAKADIRRFLAEMARLRVTLGSDGKRAFEIPLDDSSADEAFRALDRESFAAWLARNGYRSKELREYLSYCCRDDYGAEPESVSAWAGIHYFASRDGRAANTDPGTMLTWPEGLSWITDRLGSRAGARLRVRHLVYDLKRTRAGVVVEALDLATGRGLRLRARTAIVAVPRFVAVRIVAELRSEPPTYLPALRYNPWVVANLTLDRLPESPGVPPAWENAIHGSRSVGYVVATHQDPTRRVPEPTVITYYRPLAGDDAAAERRLAFARSYADWSALVLADLSAAHRDIRRHVQRLDVRVWGHGMIRPSVGFVWGPDRQAMRDPLGPIFFAHSDMSGISIFEEAQYRGVQAALAAVRRFRGYGRWARPKGPPATGRVATTVYDEVSTTETAEAP